MVEGRGQDRIRRGGPWAAFSNDDDDVAAVDDDAIILTCARKLTVKPVESTVRPTRSLVDAD